MIAYQYNIKSIFPTTFLKCRFAQSSLTYCCILYNLVTRLHIFSESGNTCPLRQFRMGIVVHMSETVFLDTLL